VVKNHLDSQKAFNLFVNIGAALKGLIMTIGLFGACLLAVYQVTHKYRSPGDFVVLLSYWQQLQGMSTPSTTAKIMATLLKFNTSSPLIFCKYVQVDI
jgi:hypothetical protein